MPPAAGPTQVPDQPVAEGAVRLGFADGSGVTLASGDPYAAALRRVAAAMLGR